MKTKKEIHELMQKAPVPQARGRKHQHFTSICAAKIFAVLQTSLGVLCMLFTEQIHSLFPFALGLLMTATGICDIYRGVVTQEFRQAETKLTARGIVTLILGCVIVYHHRESDPIIGAIWGSIGIMKGTETLNLAIYKYSAGISYIGKMVHGGVELLLGILLLLDPLTAVEHHLFILGIELVAVGIQAVKETKQSIASEKRENGEIIIPETK